MKALLQWFLNLLYPPKCILCGGILREEERDLCGKCRKAPLPRWTGAPLRLAEFERCAVPFAYEGPIRDAILRFKFRGVTGCAGLFGKWLAETVREELAGTFDLITWVPCSKQRKWTRGYDQAELLARSLAKELGTEAIPALEKYKHNRAQSRTKGAAARRANVVGVYRPCEPERYAGKRLLVVDDIITTGATMSQCGRTLLLAGAEDLVCAALASARSQ